jgi:hypothetical protein
MTSFQPICAKQRAQPDFLFCETKPFSLAYRIDNPRV